MTSLSSWGSNDPYRGLRKRKRPADPTKARGLYFRNVPNTVKVLIANESTGEVIEAPDDLIMFAVINRSAAEHLRDDLLVPAEFPESI